MVNFTAQQSNVIFQGSVIAGTIQAVANATHSQISQTVSQANIEEIRGIIVGTIDNLVSEVRNTLTAEQQIIYEKAASDLKLETAKDKPEPSKLHAILKILSFYSDLEGTLQFSARLLQLSARAGPFLIALHEAIARLLPPG